MKKRPDDWIEEDERLMKESLARINKAREAIVERIGFYQRGKSRHAQGVIDCPNCDGGKLQYTRSSYNGHISAKCDTGNCTSWVE